MLSARAPLSPLDVWVYSLCRPLGTNLPAAISPHAIPHGRRHRACARPLYRSSHAARPRKSRPASRASQLIVSLPLLCTHVMPAVIDAPHGGKGSDIAVICACVIAMLCHLSARVRNGGAPLGISMATWIGPVGLLMHAAVRQPAAGSYRLHLCIFAAVLAALRRIPTLPSHLTGGSLVHIGAALIVVCLLLTVQATTSHVPANAVADAIARAARATAVPATAGAALGPASGGASGGGASVGLAAGPTGAAASKGVDASAGKVGAEALVETREAAAESGCDRRQRRQISHKAAPGGGGAPCVGLSYTEPCNRTPHFIDTAMRKGAAYVVSKARSDRMVMRWKLFVKDHPHTMQPIGEPS